TREPFLATAFYVVADVTSSELRFASAGHPSPFLIQRKTGVVEPLKFCDPRHGPALGLFEKADYPTCRCPIGMNDLLVLFTDGLSEATNPEDEEYGLERLRAFLVQYSNSPAEQLFERLIQDVRSFRAIDEFEDDV